MSFSLPYVYNPFQGSFPLNFVFSCCGDDVFTYVFHLFVFLSVGVPFYCGIFRWTTLVLIFIVLLLFFSFKGWSWLAVALRLYRWFCSRPDGFILNFRVSFCFQISAKQFPLSLRCSVCFDPVLTAYHLVCVWPLGNVMDNCLPLRSGREGGFYLALMGFHCVWVFAWDFEFVLMDFHCVLVVTLDFIKCWWLPGTFWSWCWILLTSDCFPFLSRLVFSLRRWWWFDVVFGSCRCVCGVLMVWIDYSFVLCHCLIVISIYNSSRRFQFSILWSVSIVSSFDADVG